MGNINRFLYTIISRNQRIEIGLGSRQCEWWHNRSLALEMNEGNVKYGLASLCIGGGQGIALLLEKS
ncbi:hypothetical protein [Cytobacillus oceanisediminis]|uniref:hypothetical protein n=1 Tax=Cytobacillus oceanisediminis TaxID=665099 RepID=UPI003D7D8453